MRVKQQFNPDLRKAVQDYHLAQRDSGVQLVRWVCDPDGYSLLLVRFEDEQGRKVSGLMSCDAPWGPDDAWAVDEVRTCPREDEHDMVQGEMSLVSRFEDYDGDYTEEDDDERKYIGD
ncbi:MAG: hypothetical protein IKP40_13950 [Clostridia bacterium]|nr:hypothetical protein [Clostridia bacterium]